MAVTLVKSKIPRGPVTTTINYYSDPKDGSAPFNYVEDPPVGHPERNFGDEPCMITLQDVRGRESDFNLDKDSFQFITDVPSSKEKDFIDDASIIEKYYPEVEQLIFDNLPNCKRIFIFDHTIRSWNPSATRPPLTRCHLDQTPDSAVARVKYHLPREADELLKGRFRIINIWKPVNGPVIEFPLGMISASSAKEQDYVGIKHIYPDHIGETGGVRYSDNHQWYYWSGVDCNERIMLQCFDSDAFKIDSNVNGGRTPHSAFEDPRTPPNAAHRVSIEVRALVFC